MDRARRPAPETGRRARARAGIEVPLIFREPLLEGDWPRGLAVEAQVLAQRYPRARKLPLNFLAFDGVEGGKRTSIFFADERGTIREDLTIRGGRAISTKSVDLNKPSHQTANGLHNALKKYIEQAVTYPYSPKGHFQPDRTDPDRLGGAHVTLLDPDVRALHLELMQRPSPEQLRALAWVRRAAADAHVELVLVAPRTP